MLSLNPISNHTSETQGAMASASSGVDAADVIIEMDPVRASNIQRVFQALDGELGQVAGCGHPGHRPDDIRARLQDSAATLCDNGIDTADKAVNFLKSCWKHDATLACTAGSFFANVGYAGMMTVSSYGYVDTLPKEVLKNPATLGLVLGLTVSVVDVSLSVIGGSSVSSRLYNARCGADKLPASYPPIDSSKQFIDGMLRSTAANVIKNTSRMVSPPIQYGIEKQLDTVASRTGLINKSLHNQIDLQLDGIGGFASNAYTKMMELDPGDMYKQRLLLRSDLSTVVAKSKDSWAAASKQALMGAGQGAKALFTTATPAAIATTIATFLSILFPAYKGVESAGAADYQEQHNGTALPEGTIPYTNAIAKRAVSTSMMGLMSGAIPVVAYATANRVQPLIDSAVDTLSTRLAEWSASQHRAESRITPEPAHPASPQI